MSASIVTSSGVISAGPGDGVIGGRVGDGRVGVSRGVVMGVLRAGERVGLA